MTMPDVRAAFRRPGMVVWAAAAISGLALNPR